MSGCVGSCFFFFFKQKTAYEMRISDWSSDVCSSDLPKAVILALHGFNDYGMAFADPGAWWAQRGIATFAPDQRGFGAGPYHGYWPGGQRMADDVGDQIGRASGRERVCPYV